MNLVRSDGTPFASQGDCVSYASQGGIFMPSTCTPGTEDFSEDADGSLPTTFSGGTLDTPYGILGGVYVQGVDLAGAWAPGTHVLFAGVTVNSFQLTFASPVEVVTASLESNEYINPTTVTLTGYDAANNIVDSASADQPGGITSTSTLTIDSPGSDSIKYFTVATNDAFNAGITFTGLVWGCA